jgi:sugar porter (SP) family MFS transporter
MASETTPLIDGDTPHQETEKPPPLYVYVIAGIATINSINLGFEVGVSSGVGLLVQEDMHLTDWELGVYMGSVHYWAAVGSMFSHYFCDRLGRCKTFTVSQLIFLTGTCLLVTSKGVPQLFFSRIFTGFAVGVGLAIDPLYISEVAPASHRGQLTTLSDVAINAGVLLGFIANWAFADLPAGENWRVMPLVGIVGPVSLIILSLTVMPESPRWLTCQGRDHEAAQILRDTHGAGVDVDTLMDGIKREAQEEAQVAELGWQPILQADAPTRWMLFVGIGIACAQQIIGSESLVMYSPEIFKQAGVAKTDKDLFALTICVGILKTSFISVAACFLDNCGRRPLLLLSTVGMAAALATLSIGLDTGRGDVAVSGVFGFVAFFGVGLGPITWLLAAEVFPFIIRAKAMSIATTMNRICSATVTLTFLPLSDLLGLSGYFALFAAVSALIAITMFFSIPETKGKTLEEMKEIFDSSNFDPAGGMCTKREV